MRSKQFLLILCVMTLGGPNTVVAKSSKLNFSRVVVVYRTKLRNSSPLSQRQLMKATEQNEVAVFRSISPQRATARKTLWIANATVASVSPDAGRRLKLEKGADPLGPSPVWGARRANVGKSL